MEITIDAFTKELLDNIFVDGQGEAVEATKKELREQFKTAHEGKKTAPILEFFGRLKALKEDNDVSAAQLGFTRSELEELASRHYHLDNHGVSVGGRLERALAIVAAANERVADYVNRKTKEAPSGIECWAEIQENMGRIRQELGMTEDEWNSYEGQLKYAIDDAETLCRILELPKGSREDVERVTKQYRMRLTPYYAALIERGKLNDPVLLQAVPTGEMVDNVGEEIPPVAADHSPARLVDQFYPRVVTIKATNICAMYCTHCLRIAHIGKKDRIYSKEAYDEALNYIWNNDYIRDVLITGGDAFVLPDENLRWLLGELDKIPHLKVKRMGTRIPVTTPMRVTDSLLDVLEESNDRKPIRVVTQVNTAREITPLSQSAFRRIAKRVSTILNQAVLLRGINDSKVKMWKLCETLQEADIRPYYVFNCSYRNPQFTHMRVPIEKGRDIIEGMYGNISGDAIPRYIATCGGKVPLHRNNVVGREEGTVILRKPWSGEEARYPDASPEVYDANDIFAFAKYAKDDE